MWDRFTPFVSTNWRQYCRVLWNPISYLHPVFVYNPVLYGRFVVYIYLLGTVTWSWRILIPPHLINVNGYIPNLSPFSLTLPSTSKIQLVLVILPVLGIPNSSMLVFLERAIESTGRILLVLLEWRGPCHLQTRMLLGRCGPEIMPWTGTINLLIASWT